MTCKTCVENEADCNFTGAGTSSLRTDTIKRHEKSKEHKDAMMRAAKKKSGVRDGTSTDPTDGIMPLLTKLSDHTVNALVMRIKIIYSLLSNNRPLSDYVVQLELQNSLGLEDALRIPDEIGGGIQYTSHHFPEEVSQVIADWLFKQSAEKLRNSPVLSLMVDESTDAANLKQLIVYLVGMFEGKSFTSFGNILDIHDGKAQTITDAVLKFLVSERFDLNVFVGLGTDGASVMTGCKDGLSAFESCLTFSSGVATKLQRVMILLQAFHCLAHKLSLACSDACDDVDYLKFKFRSAINTVFDWFDNSAVRTAQLNNPQLKDLYDNPIEITMKLVKALWTRWLSSERSVRALRSSFIGVCTVMSKSKDPGTGVLKTLKTYKFVATLLLWCEVLPIFSKLSLAFQRDDVTFAALDEALARARGELNGLAERAVDEKERRKEGKESRDLFLDRVDAELAKHRAAGIDIVINDQQKNEFATVRAQWLRAVQSRLDQRFPNVNLFKWLGALLEPSQLPATIEEAVQNAYGNEALEGIISMFGKGRPPASDLDSLLKTAKGKREAKKEAQLARKLEEQKRAEKAKLSAKDMAAKAKQGPAAKAPPANRGKC
jgi:Domain of unknown function (DUF4371)